MTTFLAWIIVGAIVAVIFLLVVLLLVALVRRNDGFQRFRLHLSERRLFRLGPGRVPFSPSGRAVDVRERKRTRARIERADKP